jgi:hypothetical protein
MAKKSDMTTILGLGLVGVAGYWAWSNWATLFSAATTSTTGTAAGSGTPAAPSCPSTQVVQNGQCITPTAQQTGVIDASGRGVNTKTGTGVIQSGPMAGQPISLPHTNGLKGLNTSHFRRVHLVNPRGRSSNGNYVASGNTSPQGSF